MPERKTLFERMSEIARGEPKPPKKEGHYGPMCMDPDLCAGKGYCPRDPTCAD